MSFFSGFERPCNLSAGQHCRWWICPKIGHIISCRGSSTCTLIDRAISLNIHGHEWVLDMNGFVWKKMYLRFQKPSSPFKAPYFECKCVNPAFLDKSTCFFFANDDNSEPKTLAARAHAAHVHLVRLWPLVIFHFAILNYQRVIDSLVGGDYHGTIWDQKWRLYRIILRWKKGWWF
jgi:hypothetical protein